MGGQRLEDPPLMGINEVIYFKLSSIFSKLFCKHLKRIKIKNVSGCGIVEMCACEYVSVDVCECERV